MRERTKSCFIKTLYCLLFLIISIFASMQISLAGDSEDVYCLPNAFADTIPDVDYSEYLLYDPRTFDTDSDVETFNYLPEVKDQGDLGLCWAYAIAGAIEIDLYKNFGVEVDVAEKYLAYFAKNGFDDNSLSSTCGDGLKSLDGSQNIDYNEIYNGGGSFEHALYALLSGWGLNSQSYTDDTTSLNNYLGDTADIDWEEYRIGNVASVVGTSFFTGSESIDKTKDIIVENGSVITSLQMENLQYGLYNDHTYAYYAKTAETDHMVEIVGWNDEFSSSNFATSPESNGAWLVRNSWGNSWGDGGYFWVSYYDSGVLSTGYKSIEIEQYNEKQVLYQYDCGVEAPVTTNETTITYANVFTNNNQYEREINAVGLYVYTNGGINAQSCEIKIYRKAGAMSSPTDGALQKTITNMFTCDGYYKLNLGDSISVPAGASFSVVVTNTSSTKAYGYFEGGGINAYNSFRSAKLGQSFLQFGSSWKDTSLAISGNTFNNAGIKVYGRKSECTVHNYGVGVFEPSTCKSYAKTTYTCTVCGHQKVDENSLSGYGEHAYEQISHTNGDCVTYGYSIHKCSVCEDTKTVVDDYYGEHSYKSNYRIEGDCKNYGYVVERYCVICHNEEGEKVYDEEYGEHRYVNINTTESDCRNYSKTTQKCELCGQDNVITHSELGFGNHIFSIIEEVDGKKQVACAVNNCNATYCVYTEGGNMIVENTNAEEFEFNLHDISEQTSAIVINLKYGRLSIGVDSVLSAYSSYCKAKIKPVDTNSLLEDGLIGAQYKDYVFYSIDLLIDNVSQDIFYAEFELNVEDFNGVQFYKVGDDGVGEYIEGNISGNKVSAFLGPGIYASSLYEKADDSKETFAFDFDYLIIAGIVICIVVIGEMSARNRRKRKDED